MTRNRRPSRTVDVVYRFDPDRPTRRRAPRSPAEAQAMLVKGNRSFAHLLDSPGRARVIPLDPSDVGHGVEPGVAPVQRPFAAVLGCSDARVPIETILQQKSNDLFVVRVAGNGVGSGCLGSLRYAADHFAHSLRLKQELETRRCRVLFGAYDLASRYVRLPFAASGRKTPSGIGLFPAPDDDRAVGRIAAAVAAGASVAALLRTGKGARRH